MSTNTNVDQSPSLTTLQAMRPTTTSTPSTTTAGITATAIAGGAGFQPIGTTVQLVNISSAIIKDQPASTSAAVPTITIETASSSRPPPTTTFRVASPPPPPRFKNGHHHQKQQHDAHVVDKDALFDAQKDLANFWTIQKNDIERLEPAQLREAHRHQDLPLARIKKIMKIDDDVKSQMISAEAPVLFAKAAEMFIEELTLRAWIHTEENKRRTLQKSDLSMAISKNEQFDFLIDIVPREESLHKQNKMQQQQANASTLTVLNEHDQSLMQIDPSLLTSSQLLRYATSSAPSSATAADGTDRPVQYFIQIPSTASAPVSSSDSSSAPLVQLQNGQMVQATQIGQPIPLHSGAGHAVQLVALGADGQPIHFQFQLPASIVGDATSADAS